MEELEDDLYLMSTPVYLRGAGRGRGKRQIETKTASALGDANAPRNSQNPVLDEKEDSNIVLSNIIKQYEKDTSCRDLGTTGNFLTRTVTAHASSCPICLDDLGKTDRIWFCGSCFTEYHIKCIQKWVREMLAQKFYRSNDDDETRKEDMEKWSCPSCRQEYHRTLDWPDKYICYCGRMEDPPFDPWILPHSCGEVCHRKLSIKAEDGSVTSCSHVCLLLCHPGPCPPCPQTVRVTCYCGHAPPTSRRCSQKGWSCGKPCSRLLQCLAHRCPDPCHSGPCQPCRRTSLQPCVCGMGRQLRSCQQLEWHCDNECARPLECGNHVCRRVCHIGDCGLCPNFTEAGVRLCPCGKTSYSGLSCTEDAPTCGDTCDRILSCNLHRCERPCHTGVCGDCRELVEKRCRCGAKSSKVECSQVLVLCQSRCPRKRECGRHPCKRKCCDSSCPPCDHPCGRTLNCKNHKCPSRCHAGPCFLCGLTTSVKCDCGGTVLTLPCGALRNKKEVAVRCDLPCQKAPGMRICGHINPEHKCHRGDCPPCKDICGRPLSACKHRCPVKCHQCVLVKPKPEENREQVSGPWNARGALAPVLRELPCPPCKEIVEMECRGGHKSLQLLCHNWTTTPTPRSCGLPCDRELACGNHFCERECHAVSGEEAVQCDSCTRDCAHPRPPGCSHRCPLSGCHPGVCPPCAVLLRHRCHCSSMFIYVACAEWLMLDEQGRRSRLTCPGRCPRQLACGHQCAAECHVGDCSATNQHCTARVNVTCKCGKAKRRVLCIEKSKTIVPCGEKCRKSGDVDEGLEKTQDIAMNELPVTTETQVRHRKRKKKDNSQSEAVSRRRPTRQLIFIWIRRLWPFALGLLMFGLITWAIIESMQV